jgi:hypothetical protein
MRFPFVLAALLAMFTSTAIAQPAKPVAKTAAGADKVKMITVSEGTDMAVTVSPDHTTMLMDLQGLTYSLPIVGGEAKQITGPYDEVSHPDWSSKAPLVALQSYAGGTFHIWTMHPDGTGLKQITSGHGDDREPMISQPARSSRSPPLKPMSSNPTGRLTVLASCSHPAPASPVSRSS